MKFNSIAGFFFASGLALGCSTSGTGTGELETPAAEAGTEPRISEPMSTPDSQPVVFKWRSDGATAVRGFMTAALPDGRNFKGIYLQVTSTVDLGAYQPYWDGWADGAGGGWGDWQAPWHDSTVSVDNFATVYSGRVIATLDGPSGERLRCRFTLNDPTRGPDAGGTGECQLSTGETIQHAMLSGDDNA